MVEDFVPYSDTRALVSAGKGFRELNYILDVKYEFRDKLYLSEKEIIRIGDYVRLGHYDEWGELVHSDGWKHNHQPFMYQGLCYETGDAPNGKLYRDEELLIDHWGEVAELGNPWVVDDRIWFEVRDKDNPAPEGWNIHYADLDGGNITYFCPGANPCIYKDMLYYTIWNGTSFDFARRGVKMDDLQKASMERYADYLRLVYGKMKEYIEPGDTVMEICTRHDRGIIGKEVLPHSQYIMIDKNPKRPGLTLDAINDELPECDVLISTAILHHTAPEDLLELFQNLRLHTRKYIMLSGPDVRVLPELFGDHLYHIDVYGMADIAMLSGWRCIKYYPCGLSKPLCEVMMVFERDESC